MIKYIILALPLLITTGCYKKELEQCRSEVTACSNAIDEAKVVVSKTREGIKEIYSVAVENAHLANRCCVGFCDNSKVKANELLSSMTYRGQEVSCDSFAR